MTTRQSTQTKIRPTRQTVKTRKELSVAFLQQIIAGRIEEAYRNHVDMKGKHHNPYFSAGFPILQKAMSDDHRQFPKKQLTIRNVLGDGNLVAVHSRLVPSPEKPGYSVVHIFRFRKNRIVEMWDCVQTLPAESPNQDGAF